MTIRRDGTFYAMGTDKQVFADYGFVEPGYGMVSWELHAEGAPDHVPDHLPLFSSYGVRLRACAPEIDPEPALRLEDARNEFYGGHYATLIRDGGLFRLWYIVLARQGNGLSDLRLCYAESGDGREWVKPDLGLVEYRGNRRNNIVHMDCGGGTVFVDPAAPEHERYKHFFPRGLEGKETMWGAVSPDGLNWRELPEPLMQHQHDTQNVCFYDPTLEQYVAYFRPKITWNWGRRAVARATATDFQHFSDPLRVIDAGIADGPDADVYTNACQIWPGVPDAYLALPALYHRTSDQVDLMLMTSRDGIVWQRPSAEAYIANGSPGSTGGGMVYAGVGVAPQGKDQWVFPLTFYATTHNLLDCNLNRSGGVWLGRVREDGFTAMEAEAKGEFYTVPIRFSGSRLLVNCCGHVGSRVRVEILEPFGQALAGFTLEACDGLRENALYAPMSWKGRTDLSELRGHTVRLRFELIRTRLHGFRFA